MSIGFRVKEERERLGLSQPAFGAIGGMGKTTVQAWERGTAVPNAAFLEVAATYGVDVFYVVTGKRLENTAATPNELAFLRLARAMPSKEVADAARQALVGILASHGIKLDQSS